MCSTRINNKPANTTIINAYAPTADSRKEEKEQFYEEVSKVIVATYKCVTIIKLIRPAVTYVVQAQTFTKKDKEQMKVMERRFLRLVMGPTQTSQDEYRSGLNHEIIKEMDRENIIRTKKAQRMAWIRHIETSENKIIKQITEWKPIKDRTRERPKNG
ncbi:hypothetical protein ILUMI_16042 [Ignelater luminosus]|uniref:Uncharacterized protein n=1 Tax=Ignelater luminosus TaxID=2038154 RepID=A0A8K0G8X9_IGNLU|nr:hypothetical protein ILUMI_16042 [Ignelater luminosus]